MFVQLLSIPALRYCCDNGDLENLYVSVILSAAKNPLWNQGDPSVATLPQDDMQVRNFEFCNTLLRGNDTVAYDQLEAPYRGESKPGALGPDIYQATVICTRILFIIFSYWQGLFSCIYVLLSTMSLAGGQGRASG